MAKNYILNFMSFLSDFFFTNILRLISKITLFYLLKFIITVLIEIHIIFNNF